MDSENNENNEKKNENKIDEFSKIPKSLINEIYGEEFTLINKSFLSLKEETKNFFTKTLSDLDKVYNQVSIDFYSHVLDVTKRIIDVFELDTSPEGEEVNEKKSNNQKISIIQNYSKEYMNKFRALLDLNKQILDSVKDNVNILCNFLGLSKLLDSEKPVDEFLNKEFENIIKSWMFLKLDIKNYNINEVLQKVDLKEDFKDLLFNLSKNKTFIMDINFNANKNLQDLDKDEKEENLILNKEISKKMIEKCNKNLVKLKINDIENIDTFLNYKKDKKLENLKFLKLKNSSFRNDYYDNENEKFFNIFPNLKKLNISCCHSLEIKLIENISQNIKELYLTKNGFINSDFNTIMSEYIVPNENLRKNLEILSFADNNLTKIDFNTMVFQSKNKFSSLKELDFHKNKIYKFNINPEFFTALKSINCCFNNFSKSYFNEEKNILILLSGNVFLMDVVLCSDYFKNFEKKLNKFSSSLRYLSLSCIPKFLSQNYISNIKISDSILINLKKLDLSNNDLTCDNIFSFLKNNKRLLNLKSLNLNGNLLDDIFFEKYLSYNYHNIFIRLKHIYLSNNKIGNEININYDGFGLVQDKENEKDIYKLRLIYKFIESNKNLKKINLTRNPLSKIYSVRLEKNPKEINKYIIKDVDGKVMINCFSSFLYKIKNELCINKDGDENENRKDFNIRFDCRSNINQNFNEYPFDKEIIVFKRV